MLEQKLEPVERRCKQVAAQAATLRGRLEAAEAQCRQEQETAALLLQSNLQLHENLVQLVRASLPAAQLQATPPAQLKRDEHVVAAVEQPRRPAAAGQDGARSNSTVTKPTQSQLHREQLTSRLGTASGSAALAGSGGSNRSSGSGSSNGTDAHAHKPSAARHHPSIAAAPRGIPQAPTSSRRGLVRAGSATSAALASTARALPPHCSTMSPAAVDGARQGAVSAALAIADEHRQLHRQYTKAAERMQRVAACIAIAAPNKLRPLQAQHDEARREVRALAEQLEAKLVQLTALRSAGLM